MSFSSLVEVVNVVPQGRFFWKMFERIEMLFAVPRISRQNRILNGTVEQVCDTLAQVVLKIVVLFALQVLQMVLSDELPFLRVSCSKVVVSASRVGLPSLRLVSSVDCKWYEAKSVIS